MASLIVRNIDDSISQALKVLASSHGVSAEAEHRRILEEALLGAKKKSLAELLMEMPDLGSDDDFARIDTDKPEDIFS